MEIVTLMVGVRGRVPVGLLPSGVALTQNLG